ncbi:unnamed protein product, partial [Meganyctiphanes norvegica]
MPLEDLHEISQRLSGSVGRHDSDLDLLVREGEAVSTRLRNILKRNLGSPGLSPSRTRRAASAESPRYHSSEVRFQQDDLTLDSTQDDTRVRTEQRTRSLSDIRRTDSSLPSRAPVSTSTPLKTPSTTPPAKRRELFPLSSDDTMDDPDMYRLEEETRYLHQEVTRLEDMLTTSRIERDQMSVQYTALSDH